MVQGHASEAIREYQFVKDLNGDNKQIEKKIKYAHNIKAKLNSDLSKINSDVENNTVKEMSYEKEMTEAREHQKSGRSDNAEDIYRMILKKDPNHAEAARLLAINRYGQ